MAAKRFKLKISRVIPSFQLCRSKDVSILAQNPRPVTNYLLSPVNPKSFEISFPNRPSTPEYYNFGERRLLPEVAAVDCGCGGRSSRWHISSEKKSGRFHLVAEEDEPKIQEREFEKIVDASSFSGEINSNLSPILARKCDTISKKGKMKATVSSGESGSGWFSSEGEENEELISNSRSLSDDSSCEFQNSEKKKVKIRMRRNVRKRYRKRAAAPEIPSTVEGKVKGSVAVVMDSRDPYEDFKKSMVEMILEKQIFEAKDLEELLLCYLSLNSRRYRGVIVEAFTEIWEVLFCNNGKNGGKMNQVT